jgi:anti-sigma factor RsiW
MRCAQVVSLVERYVDGALGAGQAARISAHEATCPRCAAQVQAAKELRDVLAAQPPIRAPRGFVSLVMDAVYREALAGSRAGVAQDGRSSAGGCTPAPMYRRLGLSFLLTAGVLAASLLVPRVAYPSLVGKGDAGLSHGSNVVVQSALDGAETAVRAILREQGNGGNAR